VNTVKKNVGVKQYSLRAGLLYENFTRI